MKKWLAAVAVGVLSVLALLKCLLPSGKVTDDKVKDSLKKDDDQIQKNNEQLALEEAKRLELLKEHGNEKTNDDNIVDFFNSNK